MANWRDIQERAEAFVPKYADAKDEDRDAKPFWKDLLEIYGVDPRQMGAFEERVRIHGRPGVGKIDYFAPGKFIIEHKSRGKDLDAAFTQAMDYFDSLSKGTQPQYILLSDFARFRIYDLLAPVEQRVVEFTLEELPKHVASFGFFIDEEVRVYKPQDPIDVIAVRAIGKLHEALENSNYPQENLSLLLTRIVFCCFADDTGIFEYGTLQRYLEENTNEDGSDVGAHLHAIFEVLNKPESERQKQMHSMLQNLPYVNGGLFSERLEVAHLNREIRDTLLECMGFNWSQVSPAVFGSMFQSVMSEEERHNLGAHYTSEPNILKILNPLFLEDLKEELERAKTHREKLLALQDKLASIKLLDPACGCGNFLVVAYRELRRIENEIIARLHKKQTDRIERGSVVLPLDVDIKTLSKLSVENMYGIEIDSFPAEVARLSLWLMDHKMNMELGALFGKPLRKLPLTEAPHIMQANALQVDWEDVISKDKLTYILGNPPFRGKKEQNQEQKADMQLVWGSLKGINQIDYVSAWFKKATDFIKDTGIKVAFVSTNSITQGEQVGIIWPALLSRGVHINFAHRTFKWMNEAPGQAAVHCVIIGFSNNSEEGKKIYQYANGGNEVNVIEATNINPYLIDAEDIVLSSRSNPLCAVPAMEFGNMANDGGALIFEEKGDLEAFLKDEPGAEKYIRNLIGSEEFINGTTRWCLWLAGVEPAELRKLPHVMKRIEAVKMHRQKSSREATRSLAATPALFGEIRQPTSDYLLVPRVSSERRNIIPIGYMHSDTIVTDRCAFVPSEDLYLFGILNSEMHMSWVRTVCGRLKSDYTYSIKIVYNNFPWPIENDENKEEVSACGKAVLNARAAHPGSTLADLYDPMTMPPDLSRAHKELDNAVDRAYGVSGFNSEADRLKFLFHRYKELIEK